MLQHKSSEEERELAMDGRREADEGLWCWSYCYDDVLFRRIAGGQAAQPCFIIRGIAVLGRIEMGTPLRILPYTGDQPETLFIFAR